MAQYISVRVPWHDHDWDGTVCEHPDENTACLRLKNIAENRNDSIEKSICAQCMAGHEEDVPCIAEGGAFMSDQQLIKTVTHPYSYMKTHKHFRPTQVIYPPYTLPAKPFAWLLRANIERLSRDYGVKYNEDNEPNLGFAPSWVQDARNQRAVFDAFYRDIQPGKSLVFAYAKQVPFVEDPRRVIIAVGHVGKIYPAVEYQHTDESDLRSMTWETRIGHSIRRDHKDGFLIPYREMMAYAEQHPDFDMRSVTVFAPDVAFDEFSYAAEHVSHDTAIDVLLSCIKAFRIINDCLEEDYSDVINWLNAELSKVWEDRGAFPGLGAMLSAMGVPLGMLIGRHLKDHCEDGENIWNKVDAMFSDPSKELSSDYVDCISDTLKVTWKRMPAERKTLFRLLSRISLSVDQANILFNPNEREKNHLTFTDREAIENPYILFVKTRLLNINEVALAISMEQVDRAVFPVPSIEQEYPIEEPSKLSSGNDQRRIRAAVISVLESAALEGHTILPKNLLVNEINALNLEPACSATTDIVSAVEKFMAPEVISREMKDGTEYYKLVRMQEFDSIAEKRIQKRLKATDLEVHANWRELLDDEFDNGEKRRLSELEERARVEKTAVLEMLAKSRVSVLIGDAGTGKTSVLSVLCKQKDIKAGGVLLLAPTGKATVHLLDSMKEAGKDFTALNVAQFLVRSGRFDFDTMQYRLSDSDCTDVPDTVIIDESSMLTEDMFGTLMQALRRAKRIILVGDPNQLPPIGAGRPFVDLVQMLRQNLPPRSFPRVCSNYGELTVNRRQQSEVLRTDVRFSKLFTADDDAYDDAVMPEIAAGHDANIEIRHWSSREELEKLLLETMAEELGMKGVDDQKGFDRSLGGEEFSGVLYFNKGAAKYIEDWQILAPVRNMPQGVMNINHLIHMKYREHFLNVATRYGSAKRIAEKLGPEGIVYGDKVINVVNGNRSAYPERSGRNYIANGEIGIACGDYSSKRSSNNNYMHVEFSSQLGAGYSFSKKDFADEGTAKLELAYALTVHKAQGSQFHKVILVLAEPCVLLSREMLYTALTRQTDRIVILYNEEPYHLLKYASPAYSAIAQRYTDLFRDVYIDKDGASSYAPQIISVGGRYYEDRLVHKTMKGELVRSKSEVVIANALYQSGIDYTYEQPLVIEDETKIPDFTIEDSDTGITWYWEHCGMMDDPQYRRHWEEKKAFYRKNGIEEGKNLIVTYDEQGSIDSEKILHIIQDHFE